MAKKNTQPLESKLSGTRGQAKEHSPSTQSVMRDEEWSPVQVAMSGQPISTRQLVWRGKDEQDLVRPRHAGAALYIQERSPQGAS